MKNGGVISPVNAISLFERNSFAGSEPEFANV